MATASERPYCLAIRGNGELQPAHWGALANLVENRGFPEKMSGGSSGALTMFLTDSMASNPLFAAESELSEDQKRSLGSLMYKSLHGFVNFVGQSETAQKALRLKNNLTMVKKQLSLGAVETLKALSKNASSEWILQNQKDVVSLISELKGLGILSTERYTKIITAVETILKGGRPKEVGSLAELRFYLTDLQQALMTFGSFDAQSDVNLFFREGIVDFKKFGFEYGKVASFYAGVQWNKVTQDRFDSFLNSCLDKHSGLTWQQLVQENPECQSLLNETFKQYFSQNINWDLHNVVNRKIGYSITAYPTTSVLLGSAYSNAKSVMDSYHLKRDRTAAERFQITDTTQVRFGYWGPSVDLQTISNGLRTKVFSTQTERMSFAADSKSQKFLSLGESQWIEALRLSPAEPGLASLQAMTVNGQPAYSAGGWSDLHPIPVLKAAGCEDVVYLTRKGGESLFGQGIAKRLLNLSRDWSKLSTKDPAVSQANAQLNNQGDASDMSSNWSQLYNVANKNSSLMKSIRLADSVICTDWNNFDVFKGQINELIQESFLAPEIKAEDRLSIQNPEKFVGCL